MPQLSLGGRNVLCEHSAAGVPENQMEPTTFAFSEKLSRKIRLCVESVDGSRIKGFQPEDFEQ
jgi:hypothetical protein